jgi:hypothetical protein
MTDGQAWGFDIDVVNASVPTTSKSERQSKVAKRWQTLLVILRMRVITTSNCFCM